MTAAGEHHDEGDAGRGSRVGQEFGARTANRDVETRRQATVAGHVVERVEGTMRTRTLSLALGVLLALGMLPAHADAPGAQEQDATSATASSWPATGLSSTLASLSGGLSSLAGQLGAQAVLSSDNMEYVATIPIDAPGVSLKVRDHLDTPLVFVSGVKGISIYDISDPAMPVPMSHHPLPHSQNEDVQVAEDGTRVIIAADGNLPAPNPVTRGLHVFDTSDPSSPEHVAWLQDPEGTNHTAACADAACDWIYGSAGSIYEVVEEDGGVSTEVRGDWFELGAQVEGHGQALTRSHALNRSVHPDPETGEPVEVLISDSRPRLMMDVSDPATPRLLTSSGGLDLDDDGFIQHNNLRPNAHFWTPEGDGERERRGTIGPPGDLPGQHGRDRAPRGAGHPERGGQGDGSGGGTPSMEPLEVSGNASGQRAAEWGEDWPADGVSGGHLRPGELMIGNSESNLVPQCDEQSGGLTTWSLAGFHEGEPMRLLHQFRPVNSAPDSPYEDGNPPANALGCSGHWFDIQDGDNLIAASWYEHGVKLIEIQEDYSMEQIGYFQPLVTEAGAANWVVDRETGQEYIYSTDYARGLDIIRVHREAEPASERELAAAFHRGAARVDVAPSGYLHYKRHHHTH